MDNLSPLQALSWELLDRYQAGEASAEERARIDVLLRSAHGARQTLDAVRQALKSSSEAIRPADVPGMFARLRTRLASSQHVTHVLQDFLGGSPERALAALMELDDPTLTPEQITLIHQLIDRMREDEQ